MKSLCMTAMAVVLLAWAATVGASTVTLQYSVDNCLEDNPAGDAWKAYVVKIYMDRSFTLLNASVNYPDTTEPGWAPVLPLLPSVYDSVNNRWTGEVDYQGGTPLPVGGTLDFSYRMSFVGSAHYCQETIPIPTAEPGSLVLLLAGGMAIAAGCWFRQSEWRNAWLRTTSKTSQLLDVTRVAGRPGKPAPVVLPVPMIPRRSNR
jgi:hypothetical protein